MSDPSDSTDDAWDDAPPEAAGEDHDDEDGLRRQGEVHRVDTVPPPASGDAYSAETVIRNAPREVLDAIRAKKKAERAERAGKATPLAAPAAQAIAEPIVTPIAAPTPLAPEEKPEEKPTAAATADEEEKSEKKEFTGPTPSTLNEVTNPRRPKSIPRRVAIVIAPPVTFGELVMAFAIAVAFIVAGFYAIGSAF